MKSSDKAIVKIKDVSKNFGTVEALKDVNLEVQTGEVVLIIGPSGSGKSTLLRSVNKLENLTSGEIWIDDDLLTHHQSDIRKIREEVGMVFQNFNLFSHLTAIENIILAPVVVKKLQKQKPEKLQKIFLQG